MKEEEKKIVAVVVFIIIVIFIGGRINAMYEEQAFNFFQNNEVVIFNYPEEGSVITTQTVGISVSIRPANMTGLYIKSWYLYVSDPIEEILISSDPYYYSTLNFEINEVHFMGSEGEITVTVMLESYYNEKHEVFNATCSFEYNRYE